MKNDFLTIKQAAKLTGKSEVTIRRLIKRLLKNRTAQTDQMINLANRHGSSVYKIQRAFLIEHTNLSDETKQQLLSETSQSPIQTTTQNSSDEALSNPTPSQTTQTTSELNSTRDQAEYANEGSTTQVSSQPPSQRSRSSHSKRSEDGKGDSHPDHLHSHSTGHFSQDGFQLLQKTLDHLTTQIERKDDQIEKKDAHIERLDELLSKEQTQVENLTQLINQGNVLVHSAQQRIPMPGEEGIVDSIEPVVVEGGSMEIEEVQETPADDAEPESPNRDGGFMSRLFSGFTRSDS
jgi:hypothetical protein